MADSFLALYTGTTLASAKLDSESLVVGANTVERERMQIAGAAATEIARVMATAPVGTEMGLVVRVLPGTGGVSLGKAVAATAGATDTGVAGLLVRTDTLVTLTPTDGQYTYGRVDSVGSQWVTLPDMAQVIGSVPHDLPDTKPPVKIGGRATAALFAAVTEGDRTDASFDLQGRARILSEGQVAHDAVDTGNPHKLGFRAVGHGSLQTAVSASDRTDWISNRHGVPWVIGGHPDVVTLEAAFTSAQTNTVLVAASASFRIVVTRVALICANTNTVDVAARIGFHASTTPTTIGVVLTHPGIAPGSGFSSGEGDGQLGFGAVNDALLITCSAPTGGSVRALVSYYTAAS